MSTDPEYAALLAECPEAVAFKDTFEPRDGVDYGWVVSCARDEYGRAVEVFKRLDEKAAAIANYLGAGAGLLTLGSVTGVASGQLGAWVVLAAVPSVVLALLALALAVRARGTTLRVGLPPVPGMVGYAEFFGPRAEAAFLGQWHLCVAVMYRVIARKGGRVDLAVRCFVLAIASLSLPLGVGLARKFMGLP